MGLSHTEQRRRGVALSLQTAGIGSAYHKLSLADSKAGQPIAEWIKRGDAATDVSNGMGLTFVGPDHASHRLAILTARGLHVSGISSFVVPLRRLVKWLDARGPVEELELAEQARALFVLDFYQCYDKDECPLYGWQIQDVEVFLGERLDNKRSVFLHSAKPLDAVTWWSRNFVQRVSNVNTDVEVIG